MIEHLFVYGSLAPGRPNEHVLSEVEGSWETASVTGSLRQEGWGAAIGRSWPLAAGQIRSFFTYERPLSVKADIQIVATKISASE